MKLFGPKSYAYIIHMMFKTLNYISVFFGALISFHLLMGWLDIAGFRNPFMGINISRDSFEMIPKLFGNGAILIPIGGQAGFLEYTIMILFGFAMIILLTRFLSKIFQSLSQETIFIKSLVKNTKFLSGLLIVMATEKFINAFYYPSTQESVITDVFTLFFIGVMIWFLSKVFEEGNRIQEEIDLTI